MIWALARLATSPDLLAGLKADPHRLLSPGTTAQPADPLQQALLEQLSRRPEAVFIALEHPEAHAALGRALLETPEGAAQRLAELREAFERAARQAAMDWQRALENDPVALGEYRDLVTRFCHEQRMSWPDFPCIQVLDRRYYYACPPNEAILEYGMQRGLPPALRRVLTRFWKLHSPQAADARILRRATAPRGEPPEEGPAVVGVEAGRGMFSDVSTPDPAAVGLVPVMLQPLADRPEAAREAFALAEHARLWELEPEPAGEPGERFPVRDLGGSGPSPAGAHGGVEPAPATATPEPPRSAYVVRELPTYPGGRGGAEWHPGGWSGYISSGAASLIWTEAGWCRPYLQPFTRFVYVPSERRCRTRYFKNYGYPFGDWACAAAEPREPLVYSRGHRVGPGGWPVRNPRTDTGIGRIRQYTSAVHQVRPSCGSESAPSARPIASVRRTGEAFIPAGTGPRTRGTISPTRPVQPAVRPAPSPARPPRPEIRRMQWPGASSGNRPRVQAAPGRSSSPAIMPRAPR
jgi:hypothetical protein